MFHDRGLRGADLLRDARARPLRASSPRSPARSARRTGSRCPTRRRPSSSRSREFDAGARPRRCGNAPRRGGRGVVPGLRPARRGRTTARRGKPRTRRRRRGDGRRGDRPSDAVDGDARGRHRGRARPRPGRDRRDHELHQHLEPVGDDRRRPAGARRRSSAGSTCKPWVKTSLAPGSTVVTDYLEAGRASTSTSTSSASTSSATAARPASATPARCRRRSRRRSTENDLVVCSVLSGNRNFEGRINQDVRNNYLASPPLCVAYALAGRMDIDLLDEPLGEDSDGEPVYLRDIWPTLGGDQGDGRRGGRARTCSPRATPTSSPATSAGAALDTPEGDRYTWPDSTYVRKPLVLRGHGRRAGAGRADRGRPRPRRARRLGHHRPHLAGRRDQEGRARPGEWLIENGVEVRDFNSYGSRRGNHEVMIRGTFANVRLRNELVEKEGGFTRHFPDGEETTIYEAAMAYADEGVPLVVLAGKEYGSGSSRDWAAKGTMLLGVRAVIAESFERIHRSNLIGMGVLPLQFPDGETRRVARPDRRGDVRRRRPRERRGEDGRGDGDARRRRPDRVRGPRPPRHPERGHATSSTAASSTAFCASCAEAQSGLSREWRGGAVGGRGSTRPAPTPARR